MFAFLRSTARRDARPKTAARPGSPEGLEDRLALSAASPIVMASATTADSRSVTISYDADPSARLAGPIRFGVYRSADGMLDASDQTLAIYQAPASASAPGRHELTIPLPDGLPIDVARPNVLVVANPAVEGADTDPARTASFRKFTIGVVTHGGVINRSWAYGAPWQLQIGKLMEQQGYDAVIPFNWIDESHQPGHAAPQGARVVNQLQKLLDKLPDDTIVDLHMIGHSQGALVNTMALKELDESTPPELRGGWVQDTLLDPHAANNYVPGQMDTSATLIGGLARMIVEDYQAQAKDPVVTIPSNVDDVDVYYQHTQVRAIHLMTPSGYNLWGQVPIPNQSGATIHYYNLTQANATHSGASGVALWYRNFVAPTLGDQAPMIRELRLDGRLTNATPTTWTPKTERAKRAVDNWGPDMVLRGDEPSFAGTAAPGATVRLYVGPTSDLSRIRVLDVVTADAAGNWAASADEGFLDGRYRAIAMAYSPDHHTRPAFAIVGMAPMGRFWVGEDPRG